MRTSALKTLGKKAKGKVKNKAFFLVLRVDEVHFIITCFVVFDFMQTDS